MEEIHIENPEEFEKKLKEFKKDKTQGMHIVADFDSTLTPSVFSGRKKASSSYTATRTHPDIDKTYLKESMALFNHYFPIEQDHSIPIEEKKQDMMDWWVKHWNLMVKYNIKKKIINDVVENIILRENAEDFFMTLDEHNIPLMIFSAGIGNIIEGALTKKHLLTKNVHILSNFLQFDDEGNAVDYNRDSLVHTHNKNESVVKDNPYHKEIEQRKNVILMGDDIGDISMAKGIKHDCIIKIGFLNEKYERFDLFKKEYDIVIIKDGDMKYVNELILEIIQ